MPYDAASMGKLGLDKLERLMTGLTSTDLQGYLAELRKIISLE